jgi:hypothetical protein
MDKIIAKLIIIIGIITIIVLGIILTPLTCSNDFFNSIANPTGLAIPNENKQEPKEQEEK